ncbi:SDR family NAD(P)-dependent oxidoreductase [Maritalea sp.]|uniref:SDR family NAD(P)-dependent oxidoreductase n=1 Tax=Maritalea sp. TaxID=2003361 RepID=UPI003EFAA48B
MAVAQRKTAWVIGASSGLGAALSVRLANEGYDVVISARRVELLDQIATQHNSITSLPLDVSDHAACKLAANQLCDRAKPIDLYVFCAVSAGNQEGLHNEISNALDVGLLGCTATLEPILNQMRTHENGHIALIGSPVGFRALPGTTSYGVTKSALAHLAQSIRLEHAKQGIDVQLILPGFVDTPLTQRNQFPMPFLMPLEKAIDRIWDGLCHPSRFEVAFPKRLIWPMRLMAALPDAIYGRLMSFISNRMKS